MSSIPKWITTASHRWPFPPTSPPPSTLTGRIWAQPPSRWRFSNTPWISSCPFKTKSRRTPLLRDAQQVQGVLQRPPPFSPLSAVEREACFWVLRCAEEALRCSAPSLVVLSVVAHQPKPVETNGEIHGWARR